LLGGLVVVVVVVVVVVLAKKHDGAVFTRIIMTMGTAPKTFNIA
jgi:hypothetical protein